MPVEKQTEKGINFTTNTLRRIAELRTMKGIHQPHIWKMVFTQNDVFTESIEENRSELVGQGLVNFNTAFNALYKARTHDFFQIDGMRATMDFNEDYAKDENTATLLFLLALGASADHPGTIDREKDQERDYVNTKDFYLVQLSKLAETLGKPANKIELKEIANAILTGDFIVTAPPVNRVG